MIRQSKRRSMNWRSLLHWIYGKLVGRTCIGGEEENNLIFTIYQVVDSGGIL